MTDFKVSLSKFLVVHIQQLAIILMILVEDGPCLPHLLSVTLKSP